MPASAKQDMSRDVGKLEGSVALLTKLAFGIIGLLGLLVAGGFAIYSQLDELKTDLALSKRDISAVNEKLANLQNDVSAIRKGQSSAVEMLTRLDDRLSAMTHTPPPPVLALQINPAEAEFIRQYLKKVTGLKPIVKAGYKMGDIVPAHQLLDFPSFLKTKLPNLENTKYTVDEKGSIIIASTAEGRVLAVLSAA